MTCTQLIECLTVREVEYSTLLVIQQNDLTGHDICTMSDEAKIHLGISATEIEHLKFQIAKDNMKYELNMSKRKNTNSYKIGDAVYAAWCGKWESGCIMSCNYLDSNIKRDYGIRFGKSGLTCGRDGWEIRKAVIGRRKLL